MKKITWNEYRCFLNSYYTTNGKLQNLRLGQAFYIWFGLKDEVNNLFNVNDGKAQYIIYHNYLED
jgi:hypothetical protein